MYTCPQVSAIIQQLFAEMMILGFVSMSFFFLHVNDVTGWMARVDKEYFKDGYPEKCQNTAYDQSRAKSCCIASCQEDQGCEDGCRNWLLQSSLNYESDKWWDGLRKKCERDCERRDIYAGHNMLLFTAAQKAKALKAWWMTHHKTTDAAQCKVGCHHFRLCMNVFLNEAAPAKQWHGLFD